MALSNDSDINFDIWKSAMESRSGGPDISIHEIDFPLIMNSYDIVA